MARFLARDKTEADSLIHHLGIGLKWIHQLGANRTIGFWQVIDVKIKSITAKSVQSAETLPTDCNTYDIAIRPESSFCIADHRIADNFFKSSQVISGDVIKGALTTMWISLLGLHNAMVDENLDSQRPELGRYFDKIHISHAIPGCQQIRPVQQPLSLVKMDDKFYDVALCEGAGLINGDAPAFAIDWKTDDYSKIAKMFGWPDVKRELRIHTEIDSEKRRTADKQIFAYEIVAPNDNIIWDAGLNLSAVPDSDRPKLVEQLQSLVAQGLTGLGKTKTYAQMELLAPNTTRPCHDSNLDMRDGVWILTLQTPALLCNPDCLIATESNQHDVLYQAYAEVFDDISAQAFFCYPIRSRGVYLWKRFQYPKNYQPYLLTNEGSVFVLCSQSQEKTAKGYLKTWLRTGLPVPKWAIEKYQRDGKPGNHWSNCLYIPQNGYGEIAVNLSIHWEKAPKEKFVSV